MGIVLMKDELGQDVSGIIVAHQAKTVSIWYFPLPPYKKEN